MLGPWFAGIKKNICILRKYNNIFLLELTENGTTTFFLLGGTENGITQKPIFNIF
jgi:hypothetical protein